MENPYLSVSGIVDGFPAKQMNVMIFDKSVGLLGQSVTNTFWPGHRAQPKSPTARKRLI